MTVQGEGPMPEDARELRDVERDSHAIYGLVIITATLVADRELAADVRVSLALLWGAAIVLVLAHTYAGLIATLGRSGHWLDAVQRRLVLKDNIPVAGAVVLPTLLIGIAGLGLIELRLAIDLSIVVSLLSLLAVGAYQARRQGAALSLQLGVGVLALGLGLIVVMLEVTLSH